MSPPGTDWLDTELHHALAEGLYNLAGKLYKHSGRRHALVEIVLDHDLMMQLGIPSETEIHTAVGPVKVRSDRRTPPVTSPQSPFYGIATGRGATSWQTPSGARIEEDLARLAELVATPPRANESAPGPGPDNDVLAFIPYRGRPPTVTVQGVLLRRIRCSELADDEPRWYGEDPPESLEYLHTFLGNTSSSAVCWVRV